MTIRWSHGEPGVRAALARWYAAPAEAAPYRDDGLRLVAPLPGTDLVVKQFRVGSGDHPLREGFRALLGLSPAAHEWRALRALWEAGAPVPEPRGLARLPGGDRALVTRHVEGAGFVKALREAGRAKDRRTAARVRRRLLEALGAAVAAIHARGFSHGDLHVGNVIVGAHGPVLLDLQRAREGAGSGAQLRDLAHLDHSLAAHASLASRMRVRRVALGLEGRPDETARERLRRVGALSLRRQRAHFESRLRHALREGRAYARVEAEGGRGLRARGLAAEDVAAALAAHRAAAAGHAPRGDAAPVVLDRGARSAVCAVPAGLHRIVSKEVRAGNLFRALADALRGSPARRAWAGGHGLRFLAAGAPEPLAYLEWRRFGLPVRSLVLLEDLRPDAGAHEVLERSDGAGRDAALDALLHLLLRLHRAGVDHGDLKASNVVLRAEGERLVPRLLDLEGVRFLRRLGDARRLRALAQLNASVGDALASAPRRRFFARYAQALPFPDAAAARAEVVRQSLARRHRWTGHGCGPTAPPIPG